MKKTIIYIAAAVMAVSCIYPFDPEIPSAEADKKLVVDGSIVLGGISTINLSYVSSLDKIGEALVKPKANAWIEDSNGKRFNANTSVIADKIRIPTENLQPGLQYRAGIDVDGDTYYSDWVEAEPAPQILKIDFTCDNDQVIVWTDLKVQDSNSGYVGFTFEECWEFHTDYYPEYDINPGNWAISPLMFPWPYYWCYRYDESKQTVLWDFSSLKIEDSYSFRIHSFPCTDSRNHKRYSILVKAFAMSKDAYVYKKENQRMSELGGDLFSPEPGTLEGNIHCETNPDRQAFGYVMACEATSKREYLSSIYLRAVTFSDAFLVPVDPEDYSKYYYDLNYRPVKNVQSEEGNFIGWGPSRCINCIDAGGTLVTPEFWN